MGEPDGCFTGSGGGHAEGRSVLPLKRHLELGSFWGQEKKDLVAFLGQAIAISTRNGKGIPLTLPSLGPAPPTLGSVTSASGSPSEPCAGSLPPHHA